MRKTFLPLILIFLFIPSLLRAAVVDTVETYSTAMNKKIKAVVIRPAQYESLKEVPVVYLLHGHGGNYADWISKAGGITKLADLYNLMIVCPDGAVSSWYWDSPVDEKFKYETYVSKELVSWIDGKYKTIKDRKGRGITGLSMGGHGALYLAVKHQDVFGVAGSMSGGVDIRPFPTRWDMEKRLGKYSEKSDVWEKHTVINLVHLLTPNSLSLIIDCGIDDFFYKANVNLHEKLLYNNIPHEFVSRPGGHSWPYWNNAVGYQVLYMNNFFTSVK
jgi:S-formylglutathione hydrolase FrmB